MRLALPLTAVVLTVSAAQAQSNAQPSAVKSIIDIAAAGWFLANHCPQYRIDTYQFSSLAKSLGVETSNLKTIYAADLRREEINIDARTDKPKDRICEDIADFYGPNGAVPNMVVRR